MFTVGCWSKGRQKYYDMESARFIDSARACLMNGDRLLADAEWLYSPNPTSLALAIIAEEEFAKGFLLVLVALGVIPWSATILRASRNHACKQLLCLLMEYSDPDIDEMLARGERGDARHLKIMRLYDEMSELYRKMKGAASGYLADLIKNRNQLVAEIDRLEEERKSEDQLPADVADAINILLNERIGRWEARGWYGAQKYDPTAKAIAEGARDREKQDALYVRIVKSAESVAALSALRKEPLPPLWNERKGYAGSYMDC